MFPFWSSFIKRPELMINPKRVNISLEVIKVINLLIEPCLSTVTNQKPVDDHIF